MLVVSPDGAAREHERRWRRLDGPTGLAEVVPGVRFIDREPPIQDAA
jgi:hypothetical protein